jgi:hypothetical protein
MSTVADRTKTLRAWRRYTGLLLATFIPGAFAMSLLLKTLGFAQNSIVIMIPASAWAIGFLYFGARLVFAKCPSCGESFHTGPKKKGLPFQNTCSHCGLSLDATTIDLSPRSR